MTENIEQILVPINSQQDVLIARRAARELAIQLGMGIADQTRLATAVSELTRNVVLYANTGECQLWDISDDEYVRIRVEVRDQGSGIADIELALRDGYSTRGGLGAGLPGTQRLVDHFEIESDSTGTRVCIVLQRFRIETAKRL
jgi:serine/threonine-protein kinase RsbT